MDICVTPSTLDGCVKIPSSKSLLHRALICAALSEGISKIQNPYLSQDIQATMHALRQLGAEFEVGADQILVRGIQKPPSSAQIDCGESGSTIRFLLPIAAALCDSATFTGHGGLITRPLDLYKQAFSEHGVLFDYDGSLPTSLQGHLKSGNYSIKGNVSSQFITGLLFALPLLDGDSILEVLAPFESKSYVEITLSCLESFGIAVAVQGNCYHIQGNQRYHKTDLTIESDYSQAAFFLVANALGSKLQLKNFSENSIQGDRVILSILKSAGITSAIKNDILQTQGSAKNAFHIDASDCPDLVPILAVLACFCEGTSTIQKVERLKIKESDRIASTLELITRLGGQISYENDAISVTGIDGKFHGGTISTYNDHRIAMAAAIAATAASEPVIIQDAACINKSFPTFFEAFEAVGGLYHVIHLE